MTFRLADSLPKAVLLNFEREKAERLRRLRHFKSCREAVNDLEEEIARDLARKIERYLDQSVGACHLRRPDIAMSWPMLSRKPVGRAVLRAPFSGFDPRRARSDAPYHTLRSWKQFTSRRARKILHLSEEPFWQPESYDHWIRSEEEKARIARYIRNNPVTAGLCVRPEDWKWSSASGGKS